MKKTKSAKNLRTIFNFDENTAQNAAPLTEEQEAKLTSVLLDWGHNEVNEFFIKDILLRMQGKSVYKQY